MLGNRLGLMRERNCPIEIYYVYRDRVLESMWPRQAGWTCSTPSLGAKLNILDELRNKTCKMLNVDIKIQNILQQLENTVFETGNLVFQTDLSIICENYYWLMTIICSSKNNRIFVKFCGEPAICTCFEPSLWNSSFLGIPLKIFSAIA